MPRLVEELTTDFSAGMHDSVAPTRYPRAAAAQIVNGRIQPDGTVRRRWGTIRTSAAAANAATGWGGIWYKTAGGTDQMIVFLGTKAYKSTNYGATFTEIATGLRDDYYSFAIMRVGATNYLYAANGDTTVKRWDGTTFDTNPNAPSGVKYLATFNRRLVYAGHSGVQVQATKIGDPSVIASPDGWLIQAQELPTGLLPVGPHLLIFGLDATAYVDGYGEQTLIVAAGEQGFSRSVGNVGFRSAVPVGDNGAAWLSKRGVEYYAAGAGIQLVSGSVDRFTESIDWQELYSNPGRVSGAYDPLTRDYHLALSTDGIRNNRVLVLNLLQNIQDQRSGRRAAAAIDRLLSPSAGGLLFSGDADGYLTAGASGLGVVADADGYLTLATGADPGDPIGEDADGYLTSVTNDTLPASLFVGPGADLPGTLYSVGYDGFVRKHYGVDGDDVISAGTGGTAVELVIVDKPHLLGNPRRRKRVRVIHVATIQEAAATVRVLTRGAGVQTAEKTMTMEPKGTDQAHRRHVKEKLDADAPQVELRTTDDVRVSLLGLSAELLREPV